MRQPLTFACEGEILAGTLDRGQRSTGLLIVTGGTQIRVGAHGGQAALAQRVAGAGFPVFRFDRRGTGDSSGMDPGFRGSSADIAAAAAAFRDADPSLKHLIGYGLCDGAAALALHHKAAGLDGLLLANPWVVETDGLPPPAAIRRRYTQRLLSPAAWTRLLSGKINIGKAMRGLRAATRQQPKTLATEIAAALEVSPVPVRILLARDDATAVAFSSAYRGRSFAALRTSGRATCQTLASRSHSFAGMHDADWLANAVIAALEEAEG